MAGSRALGKLPGPSPHAPLQLRGRVSISPRSFGVWDRYFPKWAFVVQYIWELLAKQRSVADFAVGCKSPNRDGVCGVSRVDGKEGACTDGEGLGVLLVHNF